MGRNDEERAATSKEIPPRLLRQKCAADAAARSDYAGLLVYSAFIWVLLCGHDYDYCTPFLVKQSGETKMAVSYISLVIFGSVMQVRSGFWASEPLLLSDVCFRWRLWRVMSVISSKSSRPLSAVSFSSYFCILLREWSALLLLCGVGVWERGQAKLRIVYQYLSACSDVIVEPESARHTSQDLPCA
jgi:hypothetical protein